MTPQCCYVLILSNGAPASQLHERVAQWKPDDFGAVATEDRLYDLGSGEVAGDAEERKQTLAADKLWLQAYGRPYSNGKPSGTYYKYAKHYPGGVAEWCPKPSTPPGSAQL